MWIVEEEDGGVWEGDKLKQVVEDIAKSCAENDRYIPNIKYIAFIKKNGSEREFPKIINAFINELDAQYEYYKEAYESNQTYQKQVWDFFNSTRL